MLVTDFNISQICIAILAIIAKVYLKISEIEHKYNLNSYKGIIRIHFKNKAIL